MQSLLQNLKTFLKEAKKPPLIIVLGPTASGKTGLSIALAQKFNGEIISADSRQIYRGMDVGTDKISAKDAQGIKHYMIDIKSPDQTFTMADFQRESTYSIKEILNKGKIPFLVGGTGLYINAIAENYQLNNAPPDTSLRAELEKELEKQGAEHMHKMLSELDPLSASKIHPNNHRYLIRALEINLKTKQTKSNSKGESKYEIFKIGINWPREELYERINSRVDEQIDRGILNEIKTLLDQGYSRNLPAMSGLGYKEFFPYLDGEKPLEECLEDLKQATRNYAKRQITWFGRDDTIYWISPREAEEVKRS
ncbi:MAG: tRNA (adenosine(37)-N6)-dimethylallyltransferase MiaA [Patescibacteria group bacterium]|nr:tRNA (adenosine(37)-N6)-dimethylallyltransferase MiaA [Patescibacteria group bacterium]